MFCFFFWFSVLQTVTRQMWLQCIECFCFGFGFSVLCFLFLFLFLFFCFGFSVVNFQFLQKVTLVRRGCSASTVSVFGFGFSVLSVLSGFLFPFLVFLVSFWFSVGYFQFLQKVTCQTWLQCIDCRQINYSIICSTLSHQL